MARQQLLPVAMMSHAIAASVGFVVACYLFRQKGRGWPGIAEDEGSVSERAADSSKQGIPRRPEPATTAPAIADASPSPVQPQLRQRSNSAASTKLKSLERGGSRKLQASMLPAGKTTDAAGDSDSDDEDKEAKLPRDLLSPVPRDQQTTICVFGADGNLAEKKLLPTLFELWQRNLLPPDVLIVGYARPKSNGGKYDDTAAFRQALAERLPDTRVRRRRSDDRSSERPSGEVGAASAGGNGAGGACGSSGRRSGRDEEEMLRHDEAADEHEPDDPRQRFVLRCHYVAGGFNDAASMRHLLDVLDAEERRRWLARKRGVQWLQKALKRTSTHFNGGANDGVNGTNGAASKASDASGAVRMYYMSVPPFLYAGICGSLAAAKELPSGMTLAPGTTASPEGGGVVTSRRGSPPRGAGVAPPEERYVLEKPFGRDHASCASLIAELRMLRRSETYFIDHYLGKELVMNLLVLRFANVCFGAIWNRSNIKSVQVIFKERIGCEGRAGYFDQYGIIRDVMQNHLLQMVALVAMEQPLSFTAEHIRQEKLKVLNACRALSMDDLVTGQYAGYREDEGIKDKRTRTETFAAAVLHVHNPRWEGVPFVLKAGKALNDSKVELRVQFHQVPGVVQDLEQCVANELVVLVQPEPAIYWKVQNKVPGLKFEVEQVRMDLFYARSYMGYMPEAYERLLLEALVADHSHFVSEEELTAQWRIFTPVLHELESGAGPEPEIYPYGSRGPKGADQLAKRHGMTKFGGGLTPYVYLADKAIADAADAKEPAQPFQGSGAGFLSAEGGGKTLDERLN